MPGPNKGGTVEATGIKFTLTDAYHSSSSRDGDYLGEPAGLVIRARGRHHDLLRRRHERLRRHAADRSDLRPDVAVLPIGGHFTMGPREAAVALELSASSAAFRATRARSRCSPGRPPSCRELAPDVEVVELEPGETSRCEGALVRRDGPPGSRDRRRGRGRARRARSCSTTSATRGARGGARCRKAGRGPRSTRGAGRRPRSRGPRSPACSSADRRDLLELDLTELTYG